MMRHRRLGHVERSRQLAGRPLTVPEQPDDLKRVGSDNALNTWFSAICLGPFARAARLFRMLSNHLLFWFPGRWRERDGQVS